MFFVFELAHDRSSCIVEEFSFNRRITLMEPESMLKYIMENSSGIGWDGNKLTALANIGEETIARKPDVRFNSDKSFPPYGGIGMVFQEGIADGRASLTGIEVVEAIRNSNCTNHGRVVINERTPRPPKGGTPQPPQPKRLRLDTTGNYYGSSKKKDKCAKGDAIKKIAYAVEKFAESYTDASRHAPFSHVLTVLEETPELTETMYSRVVTLLASERKLADTFVLLPAHRRVAWLSSNFH